MAARVRVERSPSLFFWVFSVFFFVKLTGRSEPESKNNTDCLAKLGFNFSTHTEQGGRAPFFDTRPTRRHTFARIANRHRARELQRVQRNK